MIKDNFINSLISISKSACRLYIESKEEIEDSICTHQSNMAA